MDGRGRRSGVKVKPILSVLIDTYNHEQYIEQAVVSAVEQDFPPEDFEILVVDDGSTDRTPDIVRKFAPRVRLLRKKNGGQASAFNAAFSELRGDIVSFLDGDDWWLNDFTCALSERGDTPAPPQAAGRRRTVCHAGQGVQSVQVFASAPPGHAALWPPA